MTEVLRYAAFTEDPAGGNPAGVVLDASGLDTAAMARIAADVGYSETAFVTPGENGALAIRYFSPESEVPFCGHATIAAAVALADHGHAGPVALDTATGRVDVTLAPGPVATLTSVAPRIADVAAEDLAETLAALRWTAEDLDPRIAPALAFAGAWHLVLGVRDRARLAALDYDFDRLRALLERLDCVTLALVLRRGDGVTFDVRNPFPTGGVVEDPATGAAAAALGALLRARGLVDPPVRLTLHQGEDLGRPSLLHVDVPAGAGGIAVSGRAVPLSGG